MTEPKIAQKAPLVREETAGDKWWCACGHSKNQPYCDGSHKASGTGLTPVKVALDKPGRVAWCACKHSKKGAMCDGSHKAL